MKKYETVCAKGFVLFDHFFGFFIERCRVSTPASNDYAVALRVYQEWLDTRPQEIEEYCQFSVWAKKRLKNDL